MKIDPDTYLHGGRENTFVKRGLAHVVPNRMSVYRGTEESNTRLMDAIAAKFAVYQYDKKQNVPYDEHYDFFFWCDDKWNTTGGRESGRDMRCFTLGTNSKKPHDDQIADYERLREFVAEWQDEAASAVFEWTTQDDPEAMVAEGQRILAHIAPGETVEWHGMPGKIRWIGRNCVFMKRGARKNGYRLGWKEICEITKVRKEVAA